MQLPVGEYLQTFRDYSTGKFPELRNGLEVALRIFQRYRILFPEKDALTLGHASA